MGLKKELKDAWRIYEGDLENNKMHGLGTFICKVGREYRGECEKMVRDANI